MTTHSGDLVSLEELRSVLNSYAGPDEPRQRPARHGLRRLRPVLVVALAVVALAGTGAAIADGFGAFDGIGVADHPQTGADVIDPATAAFLEGKNCSGSYNPKTGALPNHKVCSGIPVGLKLDSARHLGQLPDGQNVYVITRTAANDNLCTVVGPPHPEIECNSTLSRSHPTTIFVYAANQPAASPLTFGVALDGVTSVSLQAGDYPNGQEVTVPVNGNLWMYPGVVNVLQPVTANFTNGTTVVEPGQGAGCAAC